MFTEMLYSPIQNSPATSQPKTRKLQRVSYHQAHIRMRSHHLLRLDDSKSVTSPSASCELHAGLMQVVSSTCSKLFHQLAASLMFTDLIKSTGLIQLVANLHQAGKIHNLCGVFGYVDYRYTKYYPRFIL